MDYKVVNCVNADDLEKQLNHYCSEEVYIIYDILVINKLYSDVQYTLILFKP